MPVTNKQIATSIAQHGAVTVYLTADMEPGCAKRLAELGMDAETLGDIWRVHSAAFAALPDEALRRVQASLRMEDRYLGQACRGGVAPSGDQIRKMALRSCGLA